MAIFDLKNLFQPNEIIEYMHCNALVSQAVYEHCFLAVKWILVNMHFEYAWQEKCQHSLFGVFGFKRGAEFLGLDTVHA